MMAISDLQAFFESGWNAHDVDVLMTFMTDDCVFESTGTGADGRTVDVRREVDAQRGLTTAHDAPTVLSLFGRSVLRG